jgi:Zinc finger, C2H2 type
MSDQTMEDSDEEFDRLSDLTLSDAESEDDTDSVDAAQNTPATTPPSSSYQEDVPRDKQKRFACKHENCSKAFNRPARLEEHLRTHTNDRACKCPYPGCSNSYLRDSHLKHHIKSAHTKVRNYKCTWKGCGKSFITGTRLRNHLATHIGHERYRCRGFGDCDQTFRKKDTLQRHIVAVHLGAKPFPCPAEACAKAFDTAEHLRQHQRTNHNPHRFCCTICLEAIEADVKLSDLGKQKERERAHFSNYSDFHIHNRDIHPPICPICDMAFPSPKALSQHQQRDHGTRTTEEAPELTFNCQHPGCDKSYSTSQSLKKHSIRHTNREKWVCGPSVEKFDFTILQQGTGLNDLQGVNNIIVGCGERFASKQKLSEHVRKLHVGYKAGTTRDAIRKRNYGANKLGKENGSVQMAARKTRKDAGMPKKKIRDDILGTSDIQAAELTDDFSTADVYAARDLPSPPLTNAYAYSSSFYPPAVFPGANDTSRYPPSFFPNTTDSANAGLSDQNAFLPNPDAVFTNNPRLWRTPTPAHIATGMPELGFPVPAPLPAAMRANPFPIVRDTRVLENLDQERTTLRGEDTLFDDFMYLQGEPEYPLADPSELDLPSWPGN